MPVTPTPAREPLSNVAQATVMTPTLINAFLLNDTVNHDTTTDAAILFAPCLLHPGKKLIYYDSTLDQAITVQLFVSFDGVTFITAGTTQAIAAGNATRQRNFIDSTALAQLANPYPYIGFQIKAAVSPTVGTITVALIVASV